MPREFAASISGFEGDSYKVELLDASGLVHYVASHYADDGWRVVSDEKLLVSRADWDTFWLALQKDKIDGWKAFYIDEGTKDGIHWGVKIHWDSLKLDSSGSNAFPDTFSDFETAVACLVGKKFTSIRPNQALEPTTTAVTPRADARVAPAVVVAHL